MFIKIFRNHLPLTKKALKVRILLWFGSLAFVVLSLFAFSFNYFLNQSIESNIKSKLQLFADKKDTKFTQEIELPKDEDEIKELLVSFNAMIKRLKEGVE